MWRLIFSSWRQLIDFLFVSSHFLTLVVIFFTVLGHSASFFSSSSVPPSHKQTYRLDGVSDLKIWQLVFFSWSQLAATVIGYFNKLQTYCFMCKYYYNLLPKSFQNCSKKNSDIHDHYTRQLSKLHHKSYNTYIRADSIVIRGITLWKLWSDDIISSPSIYVFKRKCRNFLIKPTT